jgi:hypothetical protein
MTVLPFVMVPAFLIPLYLLLHFASLDASRLEAKSRRRSNAGTVLVEAKV